VKVKVTFYELMYLVPLIFPRQKEIEREKKGTVRRQRLAENQAQKAFIFQANSVGEKLKENLNT